MAVVYRVRHASLGSLHALKVLTVAMPSVRERLLQEGRAQASMRHPNTVAVTDVIEVGGAPGLIMEFVDGPNLGELLDLVRPSVEEADALAIGIIEGVACAHGLGLIHRDLKPGNVLVAATKTGPVPKVADFGLVKLLTSDGPGAMSRTRSGSALGTPSYMAPEQIRDAKGVDARADIFSLGAILYELYCGELAFPGDDFLTVFNSIMAGSYLPPSHHSPDVPDRVVRAIHGALAVKLDDRIPDCETLLKTLRGLPAEGALAAPVSASPPRPALRQLTWSPAMLASLNPDAVPGVAGLSIDRQMRTRPRASPRAPDLGTFLNGVVLAAPRSLDPSPAPPVRRRQAHAQPVRSSWDSPAETHAKGGVAWLGVGITLGLAAVLAGVLVVSGTWWLFFSDRPEGAAPLATAKVPAPTGDEPALDTEAGKGEAAHGPTTSAHDRPRAVAPVPSGPPGGASPPPASTGATPSLVPPESATAPEPVSRSPAAATNVTVASGRVNVTVSGSGSGEVYVDGSKVGTAPLLAHPLSLGRHSIRVRNDAAKLDQTQSVTVTAEETHTLVFGGRSGGISAAVPPAAGFTAAAPSSSALPTATSRPAAVSPRPSAASPTQADVQSKMLSDSEVAGCFDDARAASGGSAPTGLKIKLTVETTGEVSSAAVQGIFGKTALADCLRTATMRLTFPAYTGTPTELTYGFPR